MMRDGFRTLTSGWRADGFDALMARISILGDWVTQNGGPDGLTDKEKRTAIEMMACALRHGAAGAIPKSQAAVQ